MRAADSIDERIMQVRLDTENLCQSDRIERLLWQCLLHLYELQETGCDKQRIQGEVAMLRLVHYKGEDGEKDCLAILSQDRSVFQHIPNKYTVCGVFELFPLTQADDPDLLPVNRQFVEAER